MVPNLKLERDLLKRGFNLIIGIDEVGRGAWAGPLTIAAVVLKRTAILDNSLLDLDVRDSKELDRKKREKLCLASKPFIQSYKVMHISNKNIDAYGLTIAQHRAVCKLTKVIIEEKKNPKPFLMMDYFKVVYSPGLLPENQKNIVRGDKKSITIALAANFAKVARDNLMKKIGEVESCYGFTTNVGYGTKKHIEALKKWGCCRYHWLTYKPIRKILGNKSLDLGVRRKEI
jgi:ribonuclease HII